MFSMTPRAYSSRFARLAWRRGPSAPPKSSPKSSIVVMTIPQQGRDQLVTPTTVLGPNRQEVKVRTSEPTHSSVADWLRIKLRSEATPAHANTYCTPQDHSTRPIPAYLLDDRHRDRVRRSEGMAWRIVSARQDRSPERSCFDRLRFQGPGSVAAHPAPVGVDFGIQFDSVPAKRIPRD